MGNTRIFYPLLETERPHFFNQLVDKISKLSDPSFWMSDIPSSQKTFGLVTFSHLNEGLLRSDTVRLYGELNSSPSLVSLTLENHNDFSLEIRITQEMVYALIKNNQQIILESRQTETSGLAHVFTDSDKGHCMIVRLHPWSGKIQILFYDLEQQNIWVIEN